MPATGVAAHGRPATAGRVYVEVQVNPFPVRHVAGACRAGCRRSTSSSSDATLVSRSPTATARRRATRSRTATAVSDRSAPARTASRAIRRCGRRRSPTRIGRGRRRSELAAVRRPPSRPRPPAASRPVLLLDHAGAPRTPETCEIVLGAGTRPPPRDARAADAGDLQRAVARMHAADPAHDAARQLFARRRRRHCASRPAPTPAATCSSRASRTDVTRRGDRRSRRRCATSSFTDLTAGSPRSSPPRADAARALHARQPSHAARQRPRVLRRSLPRDARRTPAGAGAGRRPAPRRRLADVPRRRASLDRERTPTTGRDLPVTLEQAAKLHRRRRRRDALPVAAVHPARDRGTPVETRRDRRGQRSSSAPARRAERRRSSAPTRRARSSSSRCSSLNAARGDMDHRQRRRAARARTRTRSTCSARSQTP